MRSPSLIAKDSAPWRSILVASAIVALCLYAFWPVLSCGFINLDDGGYVTDNPHVLTGLSSANVSWAFFNTSVGYYIPITWVSLMLDATCFGIKPLGFHATNLALHTANALLLLWFLNSQTGDFWKSVLVTALFALHPLRVESVAWVTERKDGLSLFFGLLTLIAYMSFARTGRSRSYIAALFCYVLSLLAKPMLTTLPPVLLVMNYWPLKRASLRPPRPGVNPSQPTRSITQLLIETAPFFGLAIADILISVSTQGGRAGASGIPYAPPATRIANAVVCYVRYIVHLLNLSRLAPVYPMPDHIPGWQVVGSVTLILALTALVIATARRRPYLALGWAWYLILLLPMLGLVANGIPLQMADRFTYAPSIGLLIIFVWAIAEPLRAAPRLQLPAFALAVALILTLSLFTRRQCRYWHDDLSLFSHTLKVTRDNWVIETAYGPKLCSAGNPAAGIAMLRDATRIEPRYAQAHYNLALELSRVGQNTQAVDHYLLALRYRPDYVEAHNNLGERQVAMGHLEEGMIHLQAAIDLDPSHFPAYNNLGVAFLKQNDLGSAASCFQQCLQINPDYAPARINLARTVAAEKRQ